MFLNQITKYKRFHRSVEDRLSRATDLAVLGRPGKARSELDKVPEDKWQDIGIAQVEVLVALTEANFEVALERLEQIYAIRAGAGRRLDSAERGRMEECHLLELLNHSILLLSLRPAEQREFIEFCVSRGAGDGFTAYVLYLVLQLATNENAREVCAGLTDSAAISPERGYSLTRSLARVCSMPDAHDLPPDAVAPFLEDESPDLSGGVGVVRRLIFLTLVLVGPAKPSITTGEIERQMASSTAFLKGLDPTTIPVWEHEATALLVSLLEVGTQLFVDSPSIQQRGDDLRAIRTSLEEAASPALTKVGDLQAEISKTLLRYRTD